MHKVRRQIGAWVAALAVGVAMAGCTGGASSAPAAVPAFWKARIAQVLAGGASDFEKRVFADYRVTDAEYREAQDLYIQCMADQGWTVVRLDSGGYSITAAAGGDQTKAVPDAVNEKCQTGTVGNVEPIYLGLKFNPWGLTLAQQIRACFEKHKVPDGAGLSDDDFLALVMGSSFVASTPAGELCTQDPLGQNGMTVQQAVANDAAKQPTAGSP